MYPSEYRYTKDHKWIELCGDRCKIGITDHAQQRLGDVVHIELPEIGAKLKQGQPFGTIETAETILELCSPVSGEVVEVNVALNKMPEVMNSAPHGSWIIVLKLSDAAESGLLLDATEYADLLNKSNPEI